jgi:hypothetical protein
MAEQSKAQPYLDWLKARQISTEPKLGSAATPVAATALSGSIAVPVWRVGDEWQSTRVPRIAAHTYGWSTTAMLALVIVLMSLAIASALR